MALTQPQEIERQLFDLIASCARDPLRFVEVAFPWGEGDLANHDGPDEWQRDILGRIRDGLLSITQAIRIAVASGHGPGKSALVAWIVLWALSTMVDTRGVVTANTATQLRTKTLARAGEMASAVSLRLLVRSYRDGHLFGRPKAPGYMAHRLHSVVGKQRRGVRRLAQSGQAGRHYFR
jgi:hypothetical protein